MNFQKVSKSFVFLIGSFFYFDYMQASQLSLENCIEKKTHALHEKITAISMQLDKELLSEAAQVEMYEAYRSKKITSEEVANKIKRDRELRVILSELTQQLQVIKMNMKDLLITTESYNV